MSSAYSSSIHTQGGAVFSGNLSANRDININHITEIKPLVHALHCSFFTSSDIFRQVQNELALLLVALDTVRENLGSASVKNSLLSGLDKELQNCHWVLLDLKDVKDHFESVGSQTQLTWEREGWKLDELADIRARLSSYVEYKYDQVSITRGEIPQVYVMDLDVNQCFARFSQSHIQKMLEVFIDEVRTGKREESVISGDSLSMNGKEAWRQLRKELQSVGISHEAFSQSRDFIMTALKKAIMDEELGGDITLKFQDMDDLRRRDTRSISELGGPGITEQEP